MSKLEATAGLFKALGHPVRLQIVELIAAEGEACVCHLEAALGLRQAYISQQLARLREAGVLCDRREGLNIFYALADPAVQQVVEAARMAGLERSPRRTAAGAGVRRGHRAACPCPRCAETARPEAA